MNHYPPGKKLGGRVSRCADCLGICQGELGRVMGAGGDVNGFDRDSWKRGVVLLGRDVAADVAGR